MASVINTGRFFVQEGEVQTEDIYVAATSAVVDGVIDGDLVVATGSLTISGTVTGDVLVAARGTVSITGTVEGSVRGGAREVVVDGGVIGDDLAIAAGSVDVDGDIGRDVLGLAASAAIDGAVGRDVLGRYFSLDVGAAVDRDVEVTVNRISIDEAAVVGGDVVYQAEREVAVATGADVAGQLIQIPTTMPFFATVVLRVALILGFLGYLVGGVVVLWLFRRTGGDAVSIAAASPWQALGVGAVAIVGVPLLLIVLAVTLVGIPLAVALLFVMMLGLLFGTVPLVAAVGVRLLGGRGGVLAGFLAAAVAWRLVAYFVPLLGSAFFIAALVWGVGAWLISAWRHRRLTPAM